MPDFHMIRGYQNLTGNHCGSTAMRNLLQHYCGLDLSEEEVLGLGSGVHFVLVENEEFEPGVFLAGRGLTMEQDVCRKARLVLGCAGDTVVTSAEAEAQLEGQPITEQTLSAAAEAIVNVSKPPPDARGSEAFKRAMLKTMVVEAGMRAVARSRGEVIKGGHRYA